jgi:hypothetical protein
MNRRDFLKASSLGALTMASAPFAAGAKDDVPAFAKDAKRLGPVIKNAEIRSNPAFAGKKAASFFIDDAIWFLRDLTRNRPKSLFDNPFLAPIKECHDKYGLKLQINLFYRTDFYYGMDEFTLAEVTDAYKSEWQANKDWLKLGFHSLQEFPDYPWLNASYADVKKYYDMVYGEIARFAGEGMFTSALVPHWCPMSKEGCRALKDNGIKIMECSIGERYYYDGDRTRLPYGHGMRIEQNRKPETAFFWRDTRNKEISASACAYNHITPEQEAETRNSFKYVYDKDTGMAFKHLFCDAPCLNLVDEKLLREDTMKLLGREYLVFSDHEQYFYKDYLAYQSDYADKIRLMSKMMKEAGYEFILVENVV